MKKTQIFFLLFLVLYRPMFAQKTILWQINDTIHHKTSILLGTDHVFGNSFVDSIPQINSYLAQSDLAVFESIEDTYKIINARKPSLEIKNHFNKRYFEKLLKVTKNWKVDIYKLEPVELQLFLQRDLIRKRCRTCKSNDTFDSFDKYLKYLAKKHKIKSLGMETSKDQLLYIRQALNNPDWYDLRKSVRHLLNSIIDENSGSFNCDFLKDYQNFNLDYEFDKNCQGNKLLKQRNDNWMKILPGLMHENNCFVAVGIYHLFYDCGLIQQLKKAGFVVKQIKIKQ